VRRGRERGHVVADLGNDHRGRGGTDAGDLVQAGHRVSERGDLGLDLGVEVGDVHVERIDVGEHLGQQEAVVVGEVPDERLLQLGDLGAHPGPGHLCQDLGVAFTGDQGACNLRYAYKIGSPDLLVAGELTPPEVADRLEVSMSTMHAWPAAGTLPARRGPFPARGLIADWLKAGVIEEGRFAPTEEGTSQGGVVSPLLLNVALHGMEQAAGVRYQRTGVHAGETVTGSTLLIRYADDLVALCHTRDEAEQVKARLADCLAPPHQYWQS
jgi:hypothetical protein